MGRAGQSAPAGSEQPRGQPKNRGQFRSRRLPVPPTTKREPAAGSRRARKQAWKQRLRTPLSQQSFSDYPVNAEAAALDQAWRLLCAAAEIRGVSTEVVPVAELDGATGRFLPEQRVVKIAALGNAGAEVATLAHEMGHVHDPWWATVGESHIQAQRLARDLERFPFLRGRSEMVAQQVALEFCRSHGIDAEAWSEVYLLDWSASTWWGRRDIERRATRAWASLRADLATVSRSG
ncbi:MAG: hypothetical protein F4Z31_01760 [Gemmatimonadetes bacterium]|nr:hypothetical protein [Gemmatimonadota bacterium]